MGLRELVLRGTPVPKTLSLCPFPFAASPPAPAPWCIFPTLSPPPFSSPSSAFPAAVTPKLLASSSLSPSAPHLFLHCCSQGSPSSPHPIPLLLPLCSLWATTPLVLGLRVGKSIAGTNPTWSVTRMRQGDLGAASRAVVCRSAVGRLQGSPWESCTRALLGREVPAWSSEWFWVTRRWRLMVDVQRGLPLAHSAVSVQPGKEQTWCPLLSCLLTAAWGWDQREPRPPNPSSPANPPPCTCRVSPCPSSSRALQSRRQVARWAEPPSLAGFTRAGGSSLLPKIGSLHPRWAAKGDVGKSGTTR